MIFIGIDPGAKGCAAVLGGEKLLLNNQSQRLCQFLTADGFLARKVRFSPDDLLNGLRVVIERPTLGRANKKTSSNGLVKNAQSQGMWIGLLRGLGIHDTDIREVWPQEWQTIYKGFPFVGNLSAKDKAAAFLKSQYPYLYDLCVGPRGGVDNNKIDAVCMALYAELLWKIEKHEIRREQR
jgi:hypothetical protein